MGGIIEDKIFEILLKEKMTAKQIQKGLKNISYPREMGTLNHHLKKMTNLKQLERSKESNSYQYYNPRMYSE